MYKLLEKLFCKKSSWQIGFGSCKKEEFTKISPPNLASLSFEDVADLDASFVADPFLLKYKDLWYCFFEIKDRVRAKGVIGVATSEDGKRWQYKGVVLEEAYHLSYPFVFVYKESIYMIPEGGEDRSVKLYKAVDFPMVWKCERILLEGEDFRDTTLLIKEGIFYFFTSLNGNDNLHLYTSTSLYEALKPHPQNPLMQNQSDSARCGGNLLEIDGRLYRFGQDCSRRYGEALWMLEITKLSKEEFAQKKVSKFFEGDGKCPSWKSRKIHHFSTFWDNERLYYAIDGEGLTQRF